MDILLERCNGRIVPEDASLKDPFKMVSGAKLNLESSVLTSIYWIVNPTKEHLAFAKDHLVLRPSKNPMITGSSEGSPIPVYHKHKDRKDVLGLPRFLGLSLFGPAKEDRRTLGRAIDVAFTKELYGHQRDIVQPALALLESWGGTSIIADCGVGKTGMALYILAQLGRKTMIVCNRSLLMQQWADAISKFLGPSVSVALLQGTHTLDKSLNADITIGSIDTIVGQRHHEVFSCVGTVIVDEMHHLAASSFVHCLPLFAARYVLGLTATPNRNDGLEHALYWLAGPVSAVYQRVPEITGKTGTVQVHKVVFSDGIQKEVINYNGTIGFSSMITELTHDSKRNALLADKIRWCVTNRKKTVVVTSTVEHAELLAQVAPSALLAGKHKDRSLAKNTNLLVATYSMLEEGYDDPELDTLILATPRSTVQQVVGRVEREHPGKAVPLVIDVVDNFSLFPNMFWKRHKFYDSRGFELVV